MRGGTASKIRTGVALAVALAGAAVARAQPTVSIHDVRVIEGSSGNWDQDVTVTLSAGTSLPVVVPWSTVSGSATSGLDFTPNSASVTFLPFSTTQTLKVNIHGDTVVEWSPTLQMDKAFFVDLGTPTNATLLKSRATVTIVDDDRTFGVRPGLQLVSAVADGNAGGGRVRLQWRVPPGSTTSGPVTDVLVRWNEGAGCTPPADTTGGVSGGQFYISGLGIPVSPPGETQVVEHSPRPFDRHCYALFAVYAGATPTTEPPVTIVATPFDSTAPNRVAWAYSTGYPDVVPPTVGADAVYTVSTDGVVHAMERGETGGGWPAGWNPVALGKPAHNRSPVVPLPYGPRLFVGTESGEVHAVNGQNGSIAWSRSQPFGGTQLLPNTPGAVQGTPAGLFKSFTGQNDLILVGGNAGLSSNSFFMLDPENGLDRNTAFTNGGMGGVPGMATVDYPGNRVFFLTTSNATLWALGLGAAGFPGFTLSALPGGNPVSYSGANGSLVARNGRLYFSVANGDLIARRLSNGHEVAASGLGEAKGFVFPDRRNTDVYFSNGSRVWCVRDTADTSDPGLTPQWFVDDIPTPSIVLQWPGTNFLYVGGGDGVLYQIDVSSGNPQGTKKPVMLESGSQIGAPSLDGPNNLVLVGSATGVVYAVRVPLP